MKEIGGLELLIRIKAETELRREVSVAAEPIRALIANASWPSMKLEEKLYKLHELIPLIEGELIKSLMQKREDKAIKEFIERVESLQEQIDELKQVQQP